MGLISNIQKSCFNNKMICIKQIFSKKNIVEIHDYMQLTKKGDREKTTKYPLIGETNDISDIQLMTDGCNMLRTRAAYVY